MILVLDFNILYADEGIWAYFPDYDTNYCEDEVLIWDYNYYVFLGFLTTYRFDATDVA